MKTISIIILFIVCCSPMFAQKEEAMKVRLGAKVVELKNFQTDNYSFPEISLSTGIMFGTRPLGSLDGLVPLQASYMHDKLGFASIKWDIPVSKGFDNQHHVLSSQKGLRTVNTLKVHRLFEVGIGICFFNKDIEKERSLLIKSYSTSRTETNYWMDMELPLRYTGSVRSGVFSYRSLINNYYLGEPALISENGTTLTTEGSKNIYEEELNDVYLTNFSTTSFYLGIDFKRMLNTSFEMDHKKVIRRELLNIYADVFLASQINMENMLVTDTITGGTQSYNVLHDNPGGFKLRKTGFRLGLEATRYYTNHSGLTVQMEGGIRPGIENVENKGQFLGSKIFAICRVMYTLGLKMK